MTDPANAVHHLLTDTLDRAVAAAPSAIRRGVNMAIKNDARALLALGSCSRQTKLVACCFIWSDVTIDESIKRAIEAERARAIAGHWLSDRNRLIALRGHLLARRYDRRFET